MLRLVMLATALVVTQVSAAYAKCPYDTIRAKQDILDLAIPEIRVLNEVIERWTGLAKSGIPEDEATAKRHLAQNIPRREFLVKEYRSAEKYLYEKCGIAPRP